MASAERRLGHRSPQAILISFGESLGICDSLTLVDFFSKTLPFEHQETVLEGRKSFSQWSVLRDH